MKQIIWISLSLSLGQNKNAPRVRMHPSLPSFEAQMRDERTSQRRRGNEGSSNKRSTLKKKKSSFFVWLRSEQQQDDLSWRRRRTAIGNIKVETGMKEIRKKESSYFFLMFRLPNSLTTVPIRFLQVLPHLLQTNMKYTPQPTFNCLQFFFISFYLQLESYQLANNDTAGGSQSMYSDPRQQLLSANLQLQAVLRAQLRSIEAAQVHNHALQKRMRALMTATTKTTKPSKVGHVPSLVASMLFPDDPHVEEALDNDDVKKKRLKQQTMPLHHKFKRWSKQELEGLAKGAS